MMDLTELIIPFGACILIGTLIGLERERKKQESKNMSAVGIRTNILISMFGAISAYLAQTFDPAIFIIGLITILILTISSHISLIVRYNRIGITTEVSTILLFLYGAMCVIGYTQLAVILAIITALVLSTRDVLHTAAKNVSDQELYDTIKFAIIAFIVLPFLPNQNFDQQIFGSFLPQVVADSGMGSVDVLNPYKIWLLIVFVSGISFLGYILVKVFGKKAGISLMGLMGGLYSSTATSLTLSHKSKELPNTVTPFVAGILLALSASFIKMFIFIRALNEELFMRVIMPMGLMFLFLLTVGLFLTFKNNKENKKKGREKKHIKQTSTFETPFKLKSALKLGGFIIGALIVAKISLAYAGIELYYLVAIVSSIIAIDDPIIVSTSAIAGNLMSFVDAKNIILLVTFLNIIQKAAIAYFFGNRKLVKPLAMTFGGLLLVTIVGFIYL